MKTASELRRDRPAVSPVDTSTGRAPFRPVGAWTPVVEASAGVILAAAFAVASAVRRRRALHPDGVAFAARLEILGGELGARLLDTPARCPAVVRMSRAIGRPEPRPDVLGLALRVPDAHGPGRHQDLLLATSGDGPVARHVLVPAATFAHPRWSTLLPYRIGGCRVVFGARPSDGVPDSARLEDLRAAVAARPVRYAVCVAEAAAGWRDVAVLTLEAPLPAAEGEALAFNPSNTGGGIEPVGLLQAVRRLSYGASQRARRLSRGARAQHES